MAILAICGPSLVGRPATVAIGRIRLILILGVTTTWASTMASSAAPAQVTRSMVHAFQILRVERLAFKFYFLGSSGPFSFGT